MPGKKNLKKKDKLKINKRILMGFVSVTLLFYSFLILLSVIQYRQYQQVRTEREGKIIEENILHSQQLVAHMLANQYASALQLFSSPSNYHLREQAKNNDLNTIKAQRELSSFVSSSYEWLSAYVYNAAADYIFSSDDTYLSEKMSDFKDAAVFADTGAAAQGQFAQLRRNPADELLISYLLSDKDSVLVLNAKAAWLFDILSQSGKIGIILSDLNGKNLTYNGKIQDSGADAVTVDADLQEELLDEMQAVPHEAIENKLVETANYLYYRSELKELALHITYILPVNTYLGDLKIIKTQITALAIFSFLLFTVILYLLWLFVIQPYGQVLAELNYFELLQDGPAKTILNTRRQIFFSKLLNGTATIGSLGDFVQMLQDLNYKPSADPFVLLAAFEDAEAAINAAYTQVMDNLRQSGEVVPNQPLPDSDSDGDAHLLVIPLVRQEMYYYLVQSKHLHELSATLSKSGLHYFISNIFSSYPHIPIAYKHLNELKQLRHFYGTDGNSEAFLLTRSKSPTAELNWFTELSGKQHDDLLPVWQDKLASLSLYRYSAVSYILRKFALDLAQARAVSATELSEKVNLLLLATCDGDKLTELFYPHLSALIAAKEEKKLQQKQVLVNQIKTIIVENLNDPNLSQKYVAARLNLSPTYLGKLIKDVLDDSIGNYINTLRLEAAAELLLSTDLSIKDICTRLGIQNSAYFYALFRKKYHISPGDYRNSHKQS